MYMVVSKWRILPGKEQDFEDNGAKVRNVLRTQPGVLFMHGFRNSEGNAVAIHAYESEDAYNKVVHDPNGAFAKALAEYKVEQSAEWISSERGETLDDD